MPLHILGALVFFGIGGVVLLVHLLKMSRADGFADAETARAAFLADFPEAETGEAALTDDRRAAVLATGAGAGLVMRFGAGRLTRLIGPGDVRRIEERPGALRLRLADLGAPVIDLAFADDGKRAEMKHILEEATIKVTLRAIPALLITVVEDSGLV